jgi:hypothetical protein
MFDQLHTLLAVKDWPLSFGGAFLLASPGSISASLWLLRHHQYPIKQ